MYRKLHEQDAAAYWALRLEALETDPLAFGPTPDEHRQTTVEDATALIFAAETFVMGAFDGPCLVGIALSSASVCKKSDTRGTFVLSM